jgi:hypothetical protein
MQKLLNLIAVVIIVSATANFMVGLIEQSINAQNMTNVSNLTGVETIVVVQV